MNFWGILKFANNCQSRKTATKGIKLRPRLLIETSNCFYFRPFMDYGSIQKPNKAWRNSTEFHLITQFFRHPQNNRKISFVLASAWRVFRFSLKEIGNLLGRLAICRFLFNCPKLKQPIATLPEFLSDADAWSLSCGSQKSFEKFPRKGSRKRNSKGTRISQFTTATQSMLVCLKERNYGNPEVFEIKIFNILQIFRFRRATKDKIKRRKSSENSFKTVSWILFPDLCEFSE